MSVWIDLSAENPSSPQFSEAGLKAGLCRNIEISGEKIDLCAGLKIIAQEGDTPYSGAYLEGSIAIPHKDKPGDITLGINCNNSGCETYLTVNLIPSRIITGLGF